MLFGRKIKIKTAEQFAQPFLLLIKIVFVFGYPTLLSSSKIESLEVHFNKLGSNAFLECGYPLVLVNIKALGESAHKNDVGRLSRACLECGCERVDAVNVNAE